MDSTHTTISVDEVIAGYCETALWADAVPAISDPDHPAHIPSWESGGMNDTHEIDQPGEDAITPLIESWVAENLALLEQYSDELSDMGKRFDAYSPGELAGHDLRLTAGGHGAGFWDRGLSDALSDALTESAKAFGDICCFEVDVDRCTFNL